LWQCDDWRKLELETTVLIRHATAADVPAIRELDRQAATAAHWSEEQYMRLFATGAGTLSQRIGLVALATTIRESSDKNPAPSAKQESAVRGFLVAHGLGAEWGIENLVVAEASRRQGLGRRLVEELIAQARAAGAQSVFLEVRESNYAARALYGNVGFAVNGLRKDYYANPSDDAILYRLGFH
jgi:ribosomal-protein-alanine N-acetyltransferase